MTRRERLEAAIQLVADDVDREQQIRGTEAMIEKGFAGWYATQHPHDDVAAEIEEQWRFA